MIAKQALWKEKHLMKTKTCRKLTEVFSRVCGYHRPIKNWNKGKQEEFKERVTYKATEKKDK